MLALQFLAVLVMFPAAIFGPYLLRRWGRRLGWEPSWLLAVLLTGVAIVTWAALWNGGGAG